MFSSIKIENFRGFKELEVKDLGQVNLFVGKNGAGKTTILEAVELLSQGHYPFSIVQSGLRRGETSFPKDFEKGNYYNVKHLFHGHHITNYNLIKISGFLKEKTEVSFLCQTTPSITKNSFDKGLKVSSTNLEITHNFHQKITWAVNIDPILGIPGEATPTTKPEFQSIPIALPFVTSNSPSGKEMHEYWKCLVKLGEENNVIESLKIIEPNLIDLVFLGDSSKGNQSIVCKIEKEKERVPLGSLGGGITRLLTLSLDINSVSDSYIFIDEIDTGIHYSVLQDLWEFIIRSAKKLNNQIFATTHSWDCIQSLGWLQNKKPELCQGARLHRVEKDKTVAFSSKELSTVAIEDIEVR